MDAPDGYIKVKNPNSHYLRATDRIFTSCCGWRKMEPVWIGLNDDDIEEKTSCMGIEFFTKIKSEPRFFTLKPYPYGY